MRSTFARPVLTALVAALSALLAPGPTARAEGPQRAVVDDGTSSVVRPDVRGDLKVRVVSPSGFSRSGVVVERRWESGHVVESATTDRYGFTKFRRGASERWYLVIRDEYDEVRRTGPAEATAETVVQIVLRDDGRYAARWVDPIVTSPARHLFAGRSLTTAWSPNTAVDGLAAPCEGALRGTVRSQSRRHYMDGCPKEPPTPAPRPEPPFVEITDAERLPPEPPSISPNQRP